jgi:membrane protein
VTRSPTGRPDGTGVPGRIAGLGRATLRSLRGHDLALYAAGITFYAGIAVVPALVIALWLTAAVVGADRVAELGSSMAAALPSPLGAPQVVRNLVRAGIGLPGAVVIAALLPASLYGEGLRRAFVSLCGPAVPGGPPGTLIGWRGRLLLLPLFVVAPALLLPVLLITPTLARLLANGGFSAALGVGMAFLVDWLVLWLVLAWIYRVMGARRPAWAAVAWGSGATASMLAGFLQGFALFLTIPLNLGLPFGGFTAIGATVAVGLWLYLLHVLVLIGYPLTLRLDERGGLPWAAPAPAPEQPVTAPTAD